MLVGYTDITNDRYGNVANSTLRNGTVSDLRSFQIANARIDHDWRGTWFGRSVQERIGVEARELTADYKYRSDITFAQNYPFPGSPEFEKHRDIALAPKCDEFSGYWDARIELGSKWAAQTGVRYDHQNAYETNPVSEWSPRASLLFAPLSTLKLRASWGRYVQSQAINELQVEDGVEQFYPPQSATHFIVSAEQTFGNGWRGRVEAYRKEYRHLQPRFENLLDPLSLLPEMEFDRTSIAPTSARAEGVEMLITSRHQGAWNGWFGYTWSRVTDRVDGKDVPRSWDQTHALNAGIIWTRGAWSIALTDLFHTGWPTTEVLVQPASAATGASAKVIIGERNGARLADFNSLDLRIKHSFLLPRGYLDVYVEAANLLDQKNPCCTTYSATRDASGAINLRRTVTNWLGITPSAGLL
jgi:outer membrane receptor protein involved in Fe transport